MSFFILHNFGVLMVSLSSFITLFNTFNFPKLQGFQVFCTKVARISSCSLPLSILQIDLFVCNFKICFYENGLN